MQLLISQLGQTPISKLLKLIMLLNRQRLLQVELNVLQLLLKQMLQLFYRISKLVKFSTFCSFNDMTSCGRISLFTTLSASYSFILANLPSAKAAL